MAQANPRENLTVELVSHWSLDNDTWIDSTGNFSLTEHGTVGNVAGKIKDGADFDAAAADVLNTSISMPVYTDDFSVFCWYRHTVNDAGSEDIIGRSSGTVDGWLLTASGSGYIWFYGNSGACSDEVLIGSLNRVYSVAAVVDSGAMDLYINGTDIGGDATCGLDGAPNRAIVIGNRNGEDAAFRGWIDECAIWNRSLSPAEVSALDNGSEGLSYAEYFTAVPSVPVVNWQGYSPANNTRQNYVPWVFYFNVTVQSPEYCELYNGVNYLSNRSSVSVDTKYNFSVNLSDGSYGMETRCRYSGVQYNSSVKYVEHDDTQPTIQCFYPLCDNSTVHINGTSITFDFNFTDTNLDGFNVTVWLPNGSVWWNNLTDNLSGGNYRFQRSETLQVNGDYDFRVKAWDDHNVLSKEAQQQRVASYSVNDAPGGKVLKAYGNDIELTSTTPLLIEWNGESWSQILRFSTTKQPGDKSRIDIRTSVPCRQKFTAHKGHLVCGMQYIDFDGFAADVRLQAGDNKFHWIAYLTIEKATNELRASSIGELNINEVSAMFESNDPPVLPLIPDRFVNTTATWTYFLNASDADTDPLSFYVNDSIVAVDMGGTLGDSPVYADNGHYWVLVSAGDGYSNVSRVFNYSINITEVPAAPGVAGAPVEFSSVPQALFYMFLLTFWLVIVIALFTVRGVHGQMIQIFNVLQVAVGVVAGVAFIPFSFVIGFSVTFVALGILLGIALYSKIV